MDLTSPEMKEITAAVMVLQQGEAARGRGLLLELWEKHAPQGAPLPRCTLAHFLADTEPEVADELEWDLRALEAATGSREAEDHEPISSDLVGLLPSLHLNVADCYRRLGELDRARRHAAFAAGRIGVLGDDPYGQLIRGGLRRLEARLANP